ncbi:MAG: TolC family protein [Candidatus Thioglobus autotrophicus]|nr:TolC family protein [Candidatus Thioglobus autotrophicus]
MWNRIACVFCLFLSTDVIAITSEEFSAKLMQTHPYFLQLSLSEKVSLVDQKIARTYTDWNIQMGANESFSAGDDISSRLYNDLYTTSYEVSAHRKIANSGANLNLKHSWSRNDKDSTVLNTNVFSLDYVKPLLQNQNGLNDRLAVDIADIDLLAKQVSLLEQAESFLASKLTKLVDLALKQELEQLYMFQLELSKQQLDLAEEKFSNSLIDKSSLLQEKDTYVKANQQWLQSSRELNILRQELASLINVKESEMVVEFDLFKEQPIMRVEPAVFVKNSRSMQKFDFDKSKLQRRLETYENKTMPSVNLNMGIASQAEDDKYFSSFGNRDFSWNIGVDVSYPLGARKESLDVERTEISIAQLDAQRRETEINLEQQVSYLLAQIDLLAELVDISLEQGELANEKVIEEKTKYDNARGQKSLLIAAQKNANLARLSNVQTAASYQKIIIDYRVATDQLFN